ncbi:Signal transduction histidine kinase, core [Moorella glycerini]|uniref:histidine kinase n=1 Tax=Neomoorella stamsii TaxID=1266720 RepID=A0A9X7P5D7_9FIRM|nr:Sensor protein ZraS [Moorella stamsii]CEP68653.1 Signal transduction histidine kinase, core [Moorella glycerini]
MPFSWWNRIRFRVLLAGLVLTILPLYLLGAYHLCTLRADLVESTKSQNLKAVEEVASSVWLATVSVTDQMKLVATTYRETLLTSKPEEQERILYSLLQQVPVLEEVSVTNQEGRELTRVSRRRVITPADLVNMHGQQVWNTAITGQTAFGTPEPGVDGRPLLAMAVPIPDRKARGPVGVLWGEVSLRGVMDHVTALISLQRATFYVVDRQGKLIGHPDFSSVLLREDLSNHPGVQQILFNNTSKQAIPLQYNLPDGREMLGAGKVVEGLGWVTLVEVPMEEALLRLQQHTRQLLLFLLIVVALVSVCGYKAAEAFTAPITRLSKAAAEVGRGRLDITVPERSTTEIGHLERSFNAMVRQLAEKARMEEAIRRAEKMAAVGQLAANVAHEINNPLATLAAYAEDLADRGQEEGWDYLVQSGTLEQYLGVVRAQVERCKTITRRLLDFARPPLGETGPADVLTAVKETVALVSYAFHKKGVALNWEAPSIKPFPRVKIDTSELQQVLFNLLQNALDATPAGGRVTIDLFQEAGMIIIRIADTGKGIPAEYLSRATEPFFTTKPPGQGTGLGLTICHHIVTKAGGNLTINSETGRGTTVSVTLPLASTGENIAAGEGKEENQ